MLNISNLNFTLKNKELFSSFNLSLNPGEILLLRGKNGSGKSTLLSIIAGILAPTSGEVSNNFKTSLCFQNYDLQFIAPTVLDDICFTPMCEEEDKRDWALSKLEEFELSYLKDAYISTLSGGEKRLVALLGVFITNSQLLLLDEPTNDLDSKNKERLFKLIEEDKRAFIISSHEDINFKKEYKELWL